MSYSTYLDIPAPSRDDASLVQVYFTTYYQNLETQPLQYMLLKQSWIAGPKLSTCEQFSDNAALFCGGWTVFGCLT